MYHSVLFSMANEHRDYDEGGMYNSNSASVDCTLSLGTPSTRRTNDTDHRQQRKRSSFMGSFGWNVKRSENTPPPHASVKPHRGRSNVKSSSGGGGDPLLARRCANCDTTSTPLWRNGPRGPKSLCNACGIRFKKEERRATAASAGGNVSVHPADTTQHHYAMGGAWTHHPHSYKTPPSYGDEFRFVEDNGVGVPFLSWRLNVTESPGLVYDLTR